MKMWVDEIEKIVPRSSCPVCASTSLLGARLLSSSHTYEADCLEFQKVLQIVKDNYQIS